MGFQGLQHVFLDTNYGTDESTQASYLFALERAEGKDYLQEDYTKDQLRSQMRAYLYTSLRWAPRRTHHRRGVCLAAQALLAGMMRLYPVTLRQMRMQTNNQYLVYVLGLQLGEGGPRKVAWRAMQAW